MSAPNLAVGAATVAAINDKMNWIAGRIQKLLANGNGSLDTSGNAATATALETPRNINGVAFDGTVNITVTVAASALTGTTLAAGVHNASISHLNLALIPVYANNALALVGGQVQGDLYRTGLDPDTVCIVH